MVLTPPGNLTIFSSCIYLASSKQLHLFIQSILCIVIVSCMCVDRHSSYYPNYIQRGAHERGSRQKRNTSPWCSTWMIIMMRRSMMMMMWYNPTTRPVQVNCNNWSSSNWISNRTDRVEQQNRNDSWTQLTLYCHTELLTSKRNTN